VNSDTFDHTSLLRFLETRFDVTVPNLTAWRRQTVGDLTSTLGFGTANDSTPKLPVTADDFGPGCPTLTDIGPFLAPPEAITVPASQRMPTQEPGQPRRR
jgi:phospholipase C